jgi:hypothetical protein
MANPVAYNSGSNPTNAIKFGTVSMSIAPSLDITGYNWRNGFENNNMWVIYSDTYSMGLATQGNSTPTIWGTPVFSQQGLIDLINSLSERSGQTAFTNITDAISWLTGQNKYFLSNQNYPYTTADGLVFFWDPGLTATYPLVGSTSYDLSGNRQNGTLTNGPTYVTSNTKSHFSFDGTDDYISFNSPSSLPTGSASRTLYAVVKTPSSFHPAYNHIVHYGTATTNQAFGMAVYLGQYLASHTWGGTTQSTSTVSTSTHYSFAISYDQSTSNTTYWINGVQSGVSAASTSTGTNTLRIGSRISTPSEFWGPDGLIYKVLVYNKVLNESEILQNYYQGPIVTTNLTYLWDASNPVSYVNGASVTYDLKQSGINGNLQNGVAYSSNFGGYWGFDGADDRILLTNSLFSFTIDANINWTVTAWVRTGTSANGLGAGSVMSNSNGGPVYSMLGINAGVMTYWHYNGTWLQSSGTVTVNDNQWHMLTWVNKSNGTMDMYVDGVLDVSNVNSQLSSNNWIDVIGSSWSAPFAGDISSVQVNKGTAMNSGQVSQQYGATRGRFQSYFPYANGGTVSTVTQNGVTYRVHTFTTSGTLTVTQGGFAEVLVVAGGGPGGGQGGNDGSGGGGAGGLVYNSGFELIDGASMSVVVGAGGAGVSAATKGQNGSNSVLGSITAIGGGAGGSEAGSATRFGNNGGSGGGAGGYAEIYTGGLGTAFQGNKGGDNNFSFAVPNNLGGGGGGGSGAPGQGGSTNSGNNRGYGGSGLPYAMPSTTTYYAGGGGCGGGYGGPGGQGGDGGGGTGGNSASGQAAGTSGTANTGGGGGGAGGSVLGGTANSGSGGSGIIIVRYIIP